LLLNQRSPHIDIDPLKETEDMKRLPIVLLGALFAVVPWHGSAWAQG